MPPDNPVVMCSRHAQRFTKTGEEVDTDGVSTMVKQYWRAACGCEVEITLVIPDMQVSNSKGRAKLFGLCFAGSNYRARFKLLDETICKPAPESTR